jgi:hypothetical protein
MKNLNSQKTLKTFKQNFYFIIITTNNDHFPIFHPQKATLFIHLNHLNISHLLSKFNHDLSHKTLIFSYIINSLQILISFNLIINLSIHFIYHFLNFPIQNFSHLFHLIFLLKKLVNLFSLC